MAASRVAGWGLPVSAPSGAQLHLLSDSPEACVDLVPFASAPKSCKVDNAWWLRRKTENNHWYLL